MSSEHIKVGIMGGSGLDDPQILMSRTEKFVDTPFGKPSDAIIIGTIGDVECVLLARHGRKHDICPTNVNFRANLYALKQEGCTHIIVTTACGSLDEEVNPGDIVIIDQFIDRTTQRRLTFYDGTVNEFRGVCHIPMHPPFSDEIRKLLIESCEELGIRHHKTGTMVSIEGPRFSSKAESLMFKAWGGHVINMTTCPEAPLAKELGIPYAAIALATDYDCWRDSTESVTVEMVLKTFKENADRAIKILLLAVSKLSLSSWQDGVREAQETARKAVMS